MGQGEHNNVVGGKSLDIGCLKSIVRQASQVRVDFTDRSAGVALSGESAQFELGVARDQARHLATGIAAGSRNRHTRHCLTLNQRWKVRQRAVLPTQRGAKTAGRESQTRFFRLGRLGLRESPIGCAEPKRKGQRHLTLA